MSRVCGCICVLFCWGSGKETQGGAKVYLRLSKVELEPVPKGGCIFLKSLGRAISEKTVAAPTELHPRSEGRLLEQLKANRVVVEGHGVFR